MRDLRFLVLLVALMLAGTLSVSCRNDFTPVPADRPSVSIVERDELEGGWIFLPDDNVDITANVIYSNGDVANLMAELTSSLVEPPPFDLIIVPDAESDDEGTISFSGRDLGLPLDRQKLTVRVYNPAKTDDQDDDSVEIRILSEEDLAVEILEPAANTDYFLGDMISFDGLVTDLNGENKELMAFWSIDDGAVSTLAAPDAAGHTTYSTDSLTAAAHTVSLQANDGFGRTGEAEVNIFVHNDDEYDVDGDCYCPNAARCTGSSNDACPSVTVGDCNDLDDSIHPDAAELCDNIDQDCDGQIQNGLDFDLDNDGFNDARSCNNNIDCNDNNTAINPNQAELCDNIDQDCDGAYTNGLDYDNDGDGFNSLASCNNPRDCNDADGTTYPGAVELCDLTDHDCDGASNNGLDHDVDRDGYNDLSSCVNPSDCDDFNNTIRPNAAELCDPVDQDCDGDPHNGLNRDNDSDGYNSLTSCDNLVDCNDADGSTNPGAPELCDPADHDCDGQANNGLNHDNDSDGVNGVGSCTNANDCDDNNSLILPGAVERCDAIDQDCDGNPSNGLDTDADSDGFNSLSSCNNATDCNDNAFTTNPGAVERCDAIDQDCDGVLYNGLDFDLDGDGANSLASCNNRIDCDDTDASTRPGAPEICDPIDHDCDGVLDNGLSADSDADGYNNLSSCSNPSDCNDGNASIHPAATELCDAIDQDCDGATQNGLNFDGDSDGYNSLISCANAVDCDDSRGTVNPGQVEQCDAVDHDCDGNFYNGLNTDSDLDGFNSLGSCINPVDCDDFNNTVNPGRPELCDSIDHDCDGNAHNGLNFDGDSDGYNSLTSCDNPVDCNDADGTSNPGAPELCDPVDHDCDGAANNGLDIDVDGDGFNIAGSCVNPGDCNDNDPFINPLADEVCDNIDHDCDGNIHNGLNTDFDGDGFNSLTSCDAPLDCNDAAFGVNPGATERCDGIDQDCDGNAFNGLDFDIDGDGFNSLSSCNNRVDCNDGLASVYPGATELCDAVDQDCDGNTVNGLNFDVDLDGYNSLASCNSGTDCNDGNAVIHPGAVELCDGIDQDCTGGPVNGLNFDNDSDGYNSITSCTSPSDCNDASGSVHPGAVELCDAIDQDCDTNLYNGLNFDNDGDGHNSLSSCTVNDDCNDNAGNNFPGNTELCDGADNDCRLGADNGLSTDNDLDGHYTAGSCATPADDCNDNDGGVYPGASESGPDGLFLDENCDGIDGNAATAVFVAPSPAGTNNPACSRAAPCATITYALTVASALGRSQMYLRAGTYAGLLDINSGTAPATINFYGGYNSSWVRNNNTVTGHTVTITGGAWNSQAVTVRINGRTVGFNDMALVAENAAGRDANGRGNSSYVVHAKTATLTFNRVDISQGNGVAGAAGANGTSASASRAASGTNGSAASSFVTACNDSGRGAGGAGANNPSCSTDAGGNGGSGGTMDSDCSFPFDYDATTGLAGTSAEQVAAGSYGYLGAGGSTCGVGGAGRDGREVHGSGGSGGGAGGVISSDLWWGNIGTAGTMGGEGGGGGGGGGSGGCDSGTDAYGAGGGGGGSGGCKAPAAGSFGAAGGGSFGIFAVSSTVTVTNSTMNPGSGGNGGAGGSGGAGQPGGLAGNGGGAAGGAQNGGSGGAGGRGGNSGAGGGGAGGHSYAIYSLSSTVNRTGIVYNPTIPGAAGSGGTGTTGTQNGATGAAGGSGNVGTCVVAGGC